MSNQALATTASSGDFKVLLVEDYEANILVATTLLESFGAAYEVARTAEEAISKLETTQYGLVLMDVQMPGMNGLQATAIVREREATHRQRRLPIVGMTAHALKGDRERCTEAGMDDYIAKPFRPETLQAVVEKYQQMALAS